MFLALSFIGKLPSYIVESIHQCRIYFSGDIYLILNDLSSQYLKNIEKYNIILINYDEVKSDVFLDTLKKYKHKFCIVHGLAGREELFIRTFERFFLVQNLMKQKNITDCLFLELDNLLYDNPEKWLNKFSKNELCFMYDNIDRCSSGIMYIKTYNSLNNFLNECISFIKYDIGFISEMVALSIYFKKYTNEVQILPTYWTDSNIPKEFYENYENYDNSIFDSAAIGIYLLGIDPTHTQGKIVKYQKWNFSLIDYTKNKFEWRYDTLGRKKPYVFNGQQWLLINNLHVHSKNLIEGLSLPL